MPVPPRSPFPRSFLIWAALPVVAAAGLRFHDLGALQPFVDESGNILTALDPRVHALVDPLGQGRPLLSVLYAPAGVWPAHALEIARGMTAFAGLLTQVALGGALARIAGRGAALAGLWLWALMPFAVFHERLALQDAFVAAALAWAAALLAHACLAEKGRAARWFFGAGLLFGLALLSKISALFALPWLGLLHFGLCRSRQQPLFTRAFLWILPGMLLPLLALGTKLTALGGRSARFGSLPSFSANDYAPLAWGRLHTWWEWHAGYGGWPLGGLLAVALVFAVKGRARVALACAAGAGLSVFLAALLYARPFARYALPDLLPLVLFLALGWHVLFTASQIWLRRGAPIAFGLLLLPWGHASTRIATDPAHASIPAGEIVQYVTGPWSGHGLGEVKRYLTAYADRHQVRCLVVTHRFSRPGNYGLMLAELADPRITVLPFTVYTPDEFPPVLAGVRQARGTDAVACFILFEGSLYPAPLWMDRPETGFLRVMEVTRAPGEHFTLYQFNPL